MILVLGFTADVIKRLGVTGSDVRDWFKYRFWHVRFRIEALGRRYGSTLERILRFIGAAVLGFLAFVFALVAGAYGIVAAGLPVWAGFLIVAGSLLLIAAIMALIGSSQSKKVKGPERAIAQVEATKSALTGVTGSAGPTTSTA